MTTRDKAYGIGASAAVLCGIAAGFFMLGSPAKQREIEADQRRVQDLQSIASQLHQRTGTPLPAQLSDIGIRRADPSTGRPYEYRRKDDTHYELCAVFVTDNMDSDEVTLSRSWRHARGLKCYQFDSTRSPW